MNSMKTLLAAAVAATAFSAPAALAEVEVAASATVANMYLWRGQDLGQGSAAVSGDVVVSMAGAYAGVWASSGDSTAGQEYDLFAGYGLEAGGFTFDLSVWNYVYSGGTIEADANGNLQDRVDAGDNFADLSDVILSVGYGPVTVTYLDNVAGDSGYSYLTVGAEYKQFSALIGMTDSDQSVIEHDTKGLIKSDVDYTHLDITYAYNDNFSLTLSQIIDDDAENSSDEQDSDLKVVVAYSLAF